MPTKQYGRLTNYLAMYRRRSAFTQPELATLVGLDTKGMVARYEQSENVPSLEVALSLGLALGQPVEELFAGFVEELEQRIAERAKALIEAMGDTPTPEYATKLGVLSKLAHPDDEHLIPCEDAA